MLYVDNGASTAGERTGEGNGRRRLRRIWAKIGLEELFPIPAKAVMRRDSFPFFQRGMLGLVTFNVTCVVKGEESRALGRESKAVPKLTPQRHTALFRLGSLEPLRKGGAGRQM